MSAERLNEASRIKGATVLRMTILFATALQVFFTWVGPLLYGSPSEVARRIGDEAGRGPIVVWGAAVCIGHILAIRWPMFQRAFGLMHGCGCFVIAGRLVHTGLPWSGGTIATIGLLGFALAITSPGRRGWK